MSSTFGLLAHIPQGDGTCRCGEHVEPYEFRGHRFVPTTCPRCQEKERLDQDRKAVRAANRNLHPQQQLRAGFEGFTFDAYAPNGNRRAYDQCLLYADTVRSSDGRGLALQGGVGIGKTHLGVSIARRVPGAYVINVAELLQELRSSFGADGRPTKVYQRCKDAPLLVLDDMGKAKPSEWVAEALYALINYRVENKLPMVITTNDQPDNWDNRWTPAVADRIRGACDLVEMSGLSHRTLKR